MFDAVFVPGGQESVTALAAQGDARHFINEAFKHCKPIAAAGEGVRLLTSSDLAGVALADGATSGIVSEHGVVSSRNGADAGSLAQSFIEAIAAHRHWGRTENATVPA